MMREKGGSAEGAPSAQRIGCAGAADHGNGKRE